MKIRTDFVTNSSSSSFILGFKDKNNIAEELRENFPDYYTETQFDIVCNDCKQNIDKDSTKYILDCLKDDSYYDIKYGLKDLYCKKGLSYRDAWEYVNSEAGKIEVQEKLDKYLSDIKERMKNYNHFVCVKYSDNESNFGEGLEFDLMPKVKNIIEIINNH